MCVLIRNQGQAGPKHPSSCRSQIPAEIKSVPWLALSLENVTLAYELLSNPRVKFPHKTKIKELAPFSHCTSVCLPGPGQRCLPCLTNLALPWRLPLASVCCNESPAKRKGEGRRETTAPSSYRSSLLVPSHLALIWYQHLPLWGGRGLAEVRSNVGCACVAVLGGTMAGKWE